MSGDSVREAHPLFPTEGGGATPTSPLQLTIQTMNMRKALALNELWHSRLPQIVNWHSCFAYVAQFEDRYFAVALWGPPIARLFNHKGYLELRRFAIAPDAPKNTASRMLAIMANLLRVRPPQPVKLISYQDTAVHAGTIYRAAGWTKAYVRNGGTWIQSKRGKRNVPVAPGEKIRWERAL